MKSWIRKVCNIESVSSYLRNLEMSPTLSCCSFISFIFSSSSDILSWFSTNLMLSWSSLTRTYVQENATWLDEYEEHNLERPGWIKRLRPEIFSNSLVCYRFSEQDWAVVSFFGWGLAKQFCISYFYCTLRQAIIPPRDFVASETQSMK